MGSKNKHPKMTSIILSTRESTLEELEQDKDAIAEAGFSYVLNHPDVPEDVARVIKRLRNLYLIAQDISWSFQNGKDPLDF